MSSSSPPDLPAGTPCFVCGRCRGNEDAPLRTDQARGSETGSASRTAEKAPTHHTRSWPFAHFGTVVAYKARRAECRNLLAQAYANTTLEQLTSVVPLYVLEDIAEQMQLAEQLFTPFREMPIEERVCAAPCRLQTGQGLVPAPR